MEKGFIGDVWLSSKYASASSSSKVLLNRPTMIWETLQILYWERGWENLQIHGAFSMDFFESLSVLFWNRPTMIWETLQILYWERDWENIHIHWAFSIRFFENVSVLFWNPKKHWQKWIQKQQQRTTINIHTENIY